MRNLNKHLTDVDEGYFEHLVHAAGFGLTMVAAGLACLVHAVLPFAFITTGSEAIAKLHDRMVVNRCKNAIRVDAVLADGMPADGVPAAGGSIAEKPLH